MQQAPSLALRLEAARAALQPRVAVRPRLSSPGIQPKRPPIVQPARAVSPRPPVRVIQCAFSKISVEKIDSKGTHVVAIRQFVESVLDSVDKAYQYVLSNPLLGALKDLDGHTKKWVQKWTQFVETGKSQLLAADFGYVIESIATHPASKFKPTAPIGTAFMLQGERGGTRPDVILTLTNGTEIAWIDITASDSNEHIFTQKTGWKNNVVEITYPSTDMSTIKGASISLTGIKIDADEIFRNIGFQKFYLEYLRQIFIQQGKELFGGLKLPSSDPILRDQLRRKWTLKILKESGPFKGLEIDEHAAANILYAMGLNPGTYGFKSSKSKSTGEHLLKTFQNVPMLTAPRQTVPLSLSSFKGGGFNFGGFSQRNQQLVSTSPTKSFSSRFRREHSNRSLSSHSSPKVRDNTERLGQLLGRLGKNSFMLKNLPSILIGSGVPLKSIKNFRIVVRDSRQEYCVVDYNNRTGVRARRTSPSLPLQGGGTLALTSSQPSLGPIVNLSPSQTLDLVGYEIETEDGEVISGVNQSLL